MPSVRYVILSDLHFGERNSILSDPIGRGLHAPLEPNEGLTGLVACLHDVVRNNADGAPPRLILLGDIFELALAPRHEALEAFARFVALLFPKDSPALFDPRLVFVPGNHDHQLWTSTRNDLANQQLSRPDGPMRATPPVTPIFDLLSPGGAEPIGSTLLTRLLRARVPYRSDLEVQVAYPNVGILSGDRALIAHHGHFMDDVYLVMSTLSRAVYGGANVASIDELEADNGAWIDFVWSSLGREGSIAAGLRRSYDLLQSDSGKILLASRVASALVRRPSHQFTRRLLQRMLLAPMIRILDAIETTDVRRALPTTERVPDEVLGYLDGPLAVAVRSELDRRGVMPSRFAFVYGHTHRPFAQTATLPQSGIEAGIYNTGGWVVDTQMPRPATGGGMVLVDDSLDAVLVQLCSQVLEPHLLPARVQGPEGDLRLHVASLVERPDGPWRRAAATLGSAILRRRAEHSARLIGEVEQLSGIERLALRTEYIWKQLLRRQTRAGKQMRDLFSSDRSDTLLRTPRVIRESSPIAVPPSLLSH